ncbi:putative von Willebrand factor A domain-containing protein [Hypsibius exemplaris]|uniref:von Willebrand factor A domain-containing protein n=1 Tax=Hypsibius exemplaris TaxID=2072580 RepID=A0A9X6NIB3_HYPEX|nr:putative von Willebrand factor A domain-containing protein [Hypsibius exemplaris]
MGGPKEASFKFSKTQEPLDRDLVIELEIKQNPQQHVEVEESSPGKYVAMLSFVPQFKASAQAKTEIIFVVDCSGSMDSEGKIEDARRALQIALRGIPKGSYFNIFLFGSDFKSLFPASQLYTERTFADAKTFADGMSANMGGTEILEPLKAIFSTSKQEGFTRQVFVLTDGEVSNTDEVTALVRANAQNTRLFLFGLGRNSSRSFVNGIAATGNGRAEIIKDGQDLENVIGRHLSRALQPAVNNAKLAATDNLEDEDINEPPYVELQAGRFKTKIPLVIPASKKVNETSTLSKLAARELIRKLEASKPPSVKPSPYWTVPAAKGTSVEERITAISLQHGVMSEYVSLVTVELRPNSSKTENMDSMELVEVPIHLVRPSPGGLTGFTDGVGGSNGGYAQQSSYRSFLQLMYFQGMSLDIESSEENEYSPMMQEQNAAGGGRLREDSVRSELRLEAPAWDGSWALTEELVKACTKGKSLAEVKAAGKNLDKEALATALAVTYLEERFPGQRDTWRAIADKAIDFLAGMWQSKEKVALDVKSKLLALVKGK